MDQITEPGKREPTFEQVLIDTGNLATQLFQTHRLSRLEIDLPVGLFNVAHLGISAVMKQPTGELAKGVYPRHPMRLSLSFRENTFIREIQQELTKPLNIHLLTTKDPRFNYKVKSNENVIISRLLVNISKIDEEIYSLISEANKFYILYCRH